MGVSLLLTEYLAEFVIPEWAAILPAGQIGGNWYDRICSMKLFCQLTSSFARIEESQQEKIL